MKLRLAVILALCLVPLGCGSNTTPAPQSPQAAQSSPVSTAGPQGSQPPTSSAVATIAPNSAPPTPQPTPSPDPYPASPAADPAAAVNAALDAIVAKDWASLPGLICADKRASIAATYDPAAGTMYPREAARALIDALEIGVTKRTVTVSSSTATTATVKVGGRLTQKVSDQALQDFGNALARAGNVTPTKDMLDGISKSLQVSMAAILLSPTAQVVAEDGGWLLCSDPLMTRPEEPAMGGQPTPKPTPTSTTVVVPTPAADPVAAVNAILDALTAKQFDKLPALMCADMRGSVSGSAGQVGDPEVQQLVDQLTIAFTNREVMLKGNLVSGVPWRSNADGALVNVAAQVKVSLPVAAIIAILLEEAAPGDPTPGPSEIKGVTDMLNAFSIAPVVRATNEGDGWLVCSDVLVMPDATGTSPSPTP